MRRSIPVVAAALGLALTMSACSSGGSNEGAATPTGAAPSSAAATTPTDGGSLTIWVDETRKTAVQDAATAFEKETGAKVTLVQKNFEDIKADFIAQVPTGKGPDITVGAHDWLGELTQNGVVAPVELGDKTADFQPVSIQAFTQDGQVYGVPYAIENIALIRNTKLASKAPKTWDDTITAGKKAKTKFPFLIQTSDQGDPYTYYPFQTSFGAPVFEQNDDGSYKPELAMGGDEGIAFAKWLAKEGEKGTKVLDTAITYDNATAAFAKGESPFIVGGPWMLDTFKDMDLSIDPLPSAGGKPAQPFVGVQGFYVSAQSKNALLANDFLINYMATDDAQTALYKAGNRPPALISAAEKASSDPITAGFAAVGKDAVPMPSIPQMGSVWQFWGVTEAGIISGKLDPTDGWNKMIKDITKAIGS
ncbi:maltose ABC transporter substrate-binding protein [Cellulomonas sp. PhB150]|uniref:sugar ABC transporter substrate-binding protein n=1 Tax=Cellulomonas sp. PhB150 TaxID=2485188 RepID=UPI000F480EC3|nr:maltose ABC transporter substrate-binding protein [Cellulomonas sp. PhB150]ROS31003.1 carbohydrate ABC transporter substrate-binding protein (CUT1 family) [Cellulomonas sp. PhB150]